MNMNYKKGNEAMNKSAVVMWWDDINPESFVLCLDYYKIKAIQVKPIDSASTELVVYGPTENVDKFLEDFEEDTLEPLETMQSGDYDDDDYEAYLNNEVNRLIELKKLDVFADCEEAY